MFLHRITPNVQPGSDTEGNSAQPEHGGDAHAFQTRLEVAFAELWQISGCRIMMLELMWLFSPHISSASAKEVLKFISDNITLSQAHLAFLKMIQKYHRKINTMSLTFCLDISLQHYYKSALHCTIPYQTSDRVLS